MTDPYSILTPGAAALAGLAMASAAALKGWNGWLKVKQLEIARFSSGADRGEPPPSCVELTGLKERVRKLEAIAIGIEP